MIRDAKGVFGWCCSFETSCAGKSECYGVLWSERGTGNLVRMLSFYKKASFLFSLHDFYAFMTFYALVMCSALDEGWNVECEFLPV
jgi:hypothetical protein